MSRGTKLERMQREIERRTENDLRTLLAQADFRRFLVWLRIYVCRDRDSLSVQSGSTQNQLSGRRDVWIEVERRLGALDHKSLLQAELEHCDELAELRRLEAAEAAQENTDA